MCIRDSSRDSQDDIEDHTRSRSPPRSRSTHVSMFRHLAVGPPHRSPTCTAVSVSVHVCSAVQSTKSCDRALICSDKHVTNCTRVSSVPSRLVATNPHGERSRTTCPDHRYT
eukprot:TRINITY_DN7140_c0_g1_i5.p1 TRINITY_DN7140_c0_g1~~TRINITY_DN7140_c0_g1_i5.p1  ORF type:complete len:112 (+),score=4.21 TRINITY_DN7140_c0_g1_i5:136-471(+)